MRSRKNVHTSVHQEHNGVRQNRDCIESNLVGPLQVKSVGGARYNVIFKDVFSKYKTVNFFKQKSDTADCFLDYTKKVVPYTDHHVKVLCCNNGSEFVNGYLKTSLATLGIQLQTSAAFTPEQNGIAEWDHRSTVESARSKIHAKGVTLKLWAGFQVKTDNLGQPYSRKDRFFAKGYRQVNGIDCQESFTPIARYDSLRIIFAINATHDLELIQLDLTAAFLNDVIEEIVHIRQPEGY